MDQIEYIKIIEGEALRDIGRASDMAWLSIGKEIKVKNLKGENVVKGTFAIHIQCPWRMMDTKSNNILFASYDIYIPNKTFGCNEYFDWDIQGGNLYDEKVQAWKNKYSEVIISNIEVNNVGDLCIQLSNGHVIEIFINTSASNECWRFFECNSRNEHLVFSGKGAMFL